MEISSSLVGGYILHHWIPIAVDLLRFKFDYICHLILFSFVFLIASVNTCCNGTPWTSSPQICLKTYLTIYIFGNVNYRETCNRKCHSHFPRFLHFVRVADGFPSQRWKNVHVMTSSCVMAKKPFPNLQIALLALPSYPGNSDAKYYGALRPSNINCVEHVVFIIFSSFLN